MKLDRFDKKYLILFVCIVMMLVGGSLLGQQKNSSKIITPPGHYEVEHIYHKPNGDYGRDIYQTVKVYYDNDGWAKFNRKDNGKFVALSGGIIRVEEK